MYENSLSVSPRTARAGAAADAQSASPTFVRHSASHRAAIEQAEKLARFEHVTVLIEGETGTGKSFVSRHIHECSPRARSPYHQVVLSTLDDNLAGSDLFGHLSGSYTDARQNRAGHFVTANKGTLFLDEIGKASLAVQRKLLHAIEHREVFPVGADRPIRLDVRLIAASTVPLDDLVSKSLFLDDLAARVGGFRVRLPALRERRADIPLLVRQFVNARAPSCGHPARAPRISAELMTVLQEAAWPRNLRQLDSTIQRLLIEAADDDEITPQHITADMEHLVQESGQRGRPAPDLVRQRFHELGSAAKAARSLGISRWTVYRCVQQETQLTEPPGEAMQSGD